MSVYFRQHHAITTSLTAENAWVVLSAIEQSIKEKIESVGTPLKEWEVRINYGIKTGYNEAFIINDLKRKELIKKCPKADDIIRPILLGKDIKRYRYNWRKLWIIFTRRGIDIEEYPAIKEHLMRYYEMLRPRNNDEDVGRKSGSYEWYEIQDNVAYYNDFEKPKIVWGNLALHSQFSVVEEGFYINAPSSFMATDRLYLLALLNSSLGEYYIKSLGVSRSGGYTEFKPMFVDKLPIPKLEQQTQDTLSTLALDVIKGQKLDEDTHELEERIDELVFRTYGFTSEEIITLLEALKR